MAPTHTRKGGRLYRYYVSTAVLKQGRDACPVGRMPAGEIEAAVVTQIRHQLVTPGSFVRTWQAARVYDSSITEVEVRAALIDFDPLWDELFPAEQARIVQLLVERVDITPESAVIRLRTEGLASLVHDLRTSKHDADASNRRAA
jgi:hypothetical protein